MWLPVVCQRNSRSRHHTVELALFCLSHTFQLNGCLLPSSFFFVISLFLVSETGDALLGSVLLYILLPLLSLCAVCTLQTQSDLKQRFTETGKLAPISRLSFAVFIKFTEMLYQIYQ